MTKNKLHAIGALTISAAIWGGSIPVIKITLNYLPPFTFLFFRMLLACAIVFPFFIKEIKKHHYHRSDLKSLVLVSLFGQTLNLSFGFVGMSRTTAFEAIILSSLVPIITVFGGVIFLKERLTPKEMIGILTVMVGVSITLVPSISELLKGESVHFIGNSFLLLSGVFWTSFVLTSKKLLDKYSPKELTIFGLFVGLLTFAPVMVWEQFSHPATPLSLLLAFPGIMYVAIGSSIIAYSLYEFGLNRLEASETDIFEYLIPIFAFFPAYILFRERFTPTFIIGASILVIGVLISSFGGTKRIVKHRLRHHRI